MRSRIVAASSESPNGAVRSDDRGQAQWKWITELGPASCDATGTFDLLEARDNPALSLEQQATSEPERPGNIGFDPYATRVFVKPKTRGSLLDGFVRQSARVIATIKFCLAQLTSVRFEGTVLADSVHDSNGS
jgi:hypothetical protein